MIEEVKDIKKNNLELEKNIKKCEEQFLETLCCYLQARFSQDEKLTKKIQETACQMLDLIIENKIKILETKQELDTLQEIMPQAFWDVIQQGEERNDY